MPRLALSVKEPSALRVAPSRTIAAALATSGAAPRLASAETARVPASTVVAPAKVFAPESVNVPAPTLVREPRPERTPSKAVLAPLAPTARATAALAALVRLRPRAPARPPRLAAVRAPKETAPASPVARLSVLPARASAWASAKVPAATRVAPVAEPAPARASVPLPVLVRPPCPLTVPLTVRVALAETAMPESAARATPRLAARATLTAVERLPPSRVRLVRAVAGMAPRLASARIAKVPAATVTPPVKVLAPLSSKVPAPALVRLAAAAPSARTELRAKVPEVLAWVTMNSFAPEVSVPPLTEAARAPTAGVTRRPPLAKVALPARLTTRPPGAAKRRELAAASAATVLVERTSTLAPAVQVLAT